jgi:hypothetical protein
MSFQSRKLGGKGSPRKKRGSTSRVKSTPKEEGGGDNLNCRNRCDRANSSPYAVHYALRTRHWQESFLQRSISILMHGLQLLIAMPALAHIYLRTLMQRFFTIMNATDGGPSRNALGSHAALQHPAPTDDLRSTSITIGLL